MAWGVCTEFGMVKKTPGLSRCRGLLPFLGVASVAAPEEEHHDTR